GIALDVSTLADWVGAAAATLMPLVEEIKAHVLAGERIHADDTTVQVLAKGKTRTGRVWTSDEGGRRAAIYTLIQTAKLNDVDPQAWLADALAWLPDHPASRIADLLPWNWKPPAISAAA
ncbi:transposase domain-containing protein, partial [Bradyrhizobium oligotrophicum]|uniref:transposase domain-containing protein n=1 Tax=Bradyrhizobium oligotrophicum TaxID=44255 RepID=UPI003EBAE59B